jgi:DNA-binding winged helix-turn-helix (wHTH) protein/TolB-like protein/Flp pilus assembly protein TadD
VKKPPTKLFYDFAEFRLDPEKHRLLRNGEIVAVTPKAVETLTVLVRNRHRLVERDELLNSIWPDVAVEDGNLTVTVSMLRKALGESSDGRKFIETVPRFGYKFVADVREVAEEVPALIVEKQTSGRIVIDEQVNLGRLPIGAGLARLFSSRLRFVTVSSAAVAMVLVFGAFVVSWNRKPEVPGAKIQSVAIVPLKSLSHNVADDALSLGLADALMTSLGRIAGVRVLSANAVSRRADIQAEPVEIGRQLNVDSVLDGTLQRANGKLRVTLRLIRTSDGAQLWSGSFDQAETEVFQLQDAMATQTAQSLKWSLTGEEQVSRRYTQNREAYEAYLRGRFFFDKRTSENYQQALSEFEKAIALDPNYALAYAGLSDVYALQANVSNGATRYGLYEKSRATALKALALDDRLAEAHTSLGWIKRVHDWNWTASEQEFKRALELNPNDVNARQWYGMLLATVGRTEEALSQIEKARELAPLSVIVLSNYFVVRQHRRDHRELPALAAQIARLDPSWETHHRLSLLAQLRNGNYQNVIEMGEAFQARREKEPPPIYLAALLAIAYNKTGQTAKAAQLIEYLAERAKTASFAAYQLATVYAEIGRKDEALTFLQASFDSHDDRMVWLKVEPSFDTLRGDERFNQLMRKMNL